MFDQVILTFIHNKVEMLDMNVNSQTILRLLGYILSYFQVYYLKFLKSIFLCKVENLGIDVQS